MRVMARWMTVALLTVLPLDAGAAPCGASNGLLVSLANVATVAPDWCPGINETPDADVGLILLAGGIPMETFRGPQCQAELVRLLFQMKATYEQDKAAWCTAARTALAGNPLTSAAVAEPAAAKPADACSELDNGAALVEALIANCPGHEATAGGRVVVKFGKARCVAERKQEFDRIIETRAKATRLPLAQARAAWCRATLREHDDQMRENGIKSWVIERREAR